MQDKIVSNKDSREALVAYFKTMQAKHPIKEVEPGYGEGLIPFKKFKGNPGRLKKLKVAFPVLENNTESSCPLHKEELFAYLRYNYLFDEQSTQEELKFLRTARVATDMYWVWEVADESWTTVCWVVQSPNGGVYVGQEENDAGWTPEQFLLGNYYGMANFFLEDPP